MAAARAGQRRQLIQYQGIATVPEAPDLAVVKEVLDHRVIGRTVESARILKPTVLRSMASQDFTKDIAGRCIQRVVRKGKFLLIDFLTTVSSSSIPCSRVGWSCVRRRAKS